MHLSVWFNIVVELYNAGFFGCEGGTNFVERPREIVSVVIQRVIGVLAGVEAAVFLI